MLRNVITVAFVLFAIVVSAEEECTRKRTVCKTDKNSSVEPTVYERKSDVGVRSTPFFDLPVGGDYPQKMIVFNKDMYGSEDGLLSEDADDIVGVLEGFCVETLFSGNFDGECHVSFATAEGSLMISGPILLDDFAEGGSFDTIPTVFAVVGGTGDYKGASGEVAFSAGPSTKFLSFRYDFDCTVSG